MKEDLIACQGWNVKVSDGFCLIQTLKKKQSFTGTVGQRDDSTLKRHAIPEWTQHQ